RNGRQSDSGNRFETICLSRAVNSVLSQVFLSDVFTYIRRIRWHGSFPRDFCGAQQQPPIKSRAQPKRMAVASQSGTGSPPRPAKFGMAIRVSLPVNPTIGATKTSSL